MAPISWPYDALLHKQNNRIFGVSGAIPVSNGVSLMRPTWRASACEAEDFRSNEASTTELVFGASLFRIE
jgi:hypothetical protein